MLGVMGVTRNKVFVVNTCVNLLLMARTKVGVFPTLTNTVVKNTILKCKLRLLTLHPLHGRGTARLTPLVDAVNMSAFLRDITLVI